MKNFLIYKSSAGSGKTYTLVKEYLKIVLQNPENYRHTLAITFTNKAAEEMKNRIVEKLALLLEGGDKELEQTLISEGVKVDIPAQAKAVLNNILHNYSYFSVLTIDSFFHRIIRSFEKELKLQIGYDIEMNQDEVLDKVTDDLLADIGSDTELTSYLEDFAFTRIEESKDWKIDRQITNIGKEIFKERYWEKRNASGDDVTENRRRTREFIDSVSRIIKDFENEMSEIGNQANRIVTEYRLDVSEFPHGKNGYMNYLLNKIRDQDYVPGKRVREACEDPQKFVISKTTETVIKALDGGIKELLCKAVDLYDKEHRHYNTAKELTKTIYVIGIFQDLLDKLKSYRDENRCLLISDTNNILQKVISGESSPFIYEKVGSVYKYFLIDEFQDTSTFQWGNLLPLIINTLSENNFSMVVGDVKQSIFRWRNGNMLLLLEKIYEHLAGYNEMIEDKYLVENFRSRKEIVKFNNAFFKRAVQILGEKSGADGAGLITRAYNDIKQKPAKYKEGGYVNITFIPPDPESELTTREKANLKLLETVSLLIDDKVPLKDIMILVRTNREGSQAASLLLEKGYRVVSSESMLLTNSPKVKLIINSLKYIEDRKNDLAKTEVLYNFSLITNSGRDLNSVFTDYVSDNLFNKLMPGSFFKQDENGNTDFTRINPQLNNFPLYELVEKIINIFVLGEKPDAYLLRFKDSVLEFEQKNSSDITGFLDWWEDNKDSVSIIVPEEENAIRIMTIHRAKGLQSPIIIIPYANWTMGLEGTKEYIWVSNGGEKPFGRTPFLVRAVKNLTYTLFENDYYEESVLTNLDNLNLLYVAFTRPIDRLYVVAPERGDKKDTAESLTRQTITSVPELQSKYNAAEGKFEIGAKGTYTEKSKDLLTKPLETKGYKSADIHSKVVILPKHRTHELIQSTSGTTKMTSKVKRGIILHAVLSCIKTPNDIDNAITLVQATGLITDDVKDILKKEIQEILDLDEVKPWFTGDWEVKTEAEILLPDGRIFRPDRVMIKADKAIVIDYKTGSPKPEDSEQLNDYAKSLLEAGYKSVDKYILYIENRKVVRL